MVHQYFHRYGVVLGTFEQSAAHGLTEEDLTRAPFQISVLGISTISKLLSENNLHGEYTLEQNDAIWTLKLIINEGIWRWKPVESWHRAPTKGRAQHEVKAEVGEGVGGIKTD